MLLEIGLMLATVPAANACDLVLAQDEQAVTCVESSSPALSFGEVEMKGFTFEITENESQPGDTIGGVRYELGPAPSDGFYKFGIIPGCIRDGVLVRAGIGTAHSMPAYHIVKKSDPAQVFWYAQDPCLEPGERVAVAFGGYSDSEPVGDDYEAGWSDGPSVGPLRFRVEESPHHGEAGQVRLVVSQDACSGAFAPNWWTDPCWDGLKTEFGSDSVIRRFEEADGTAISQTTVPASQLFAGSSGNWLSSVTVVVNAEEFGAFEGGVAGSNSKTTWFYPVGSPDRGDGDDVSFGYDNVATILRDSVLADMVYNPMVPDLGLATGQCGDWDCVTTYCGTDDGSAQIFHLLSYFKCWFQFDVPWDHYADVQSDNFKLIEPFAVIDSAVGLFTAWPNSAAALNGACGPLGDLSGTVLDGAVMDTCELPHQSTIRLILGAFVALGFVTAIVGMLHSWATTGKIRAPRSTDESE